jgi:hypothetical protein
MARLRGADNRGSHAASTGSHLALQHPHETHPSFGQHPPIEAERDGRRELGLDTGPVRAPPRYTGGATDAQAVSLGPRPGGVVGKPLGSANHPGQRQDWIKVNNTCYA